jgi:transcriptional regulator of arginine metabolism
MRALSFPQGAAALQARRDAIGRLVRERRIATQEELRRLLAREGFAVNQATLSRDLAQLGARRVALPSGGTAYELDAHVSADDKDALRRLRTLIRSVEDNGSLVVIQTLPGAASAIAAAVDDAALPEVLATLAGDDTIFLAPRRGATAAAAAKRLRKLWETA